jgi:hypothetical protein
MTYNIPATVSELAASTSRGASFHSTRFDVEGHAVHVLSGHPFSDTDRKHRLTDHVARGAEWARANYMLASYPDARQYRPEVTVFYLRDRRSNQVMAAVQQDGAILDEIEIIRPDLRPATVAGLREGLANLGGWAFEH